MDARMVFRHHRYGKSPCRIPTSLLRRQYEQLPAFLFLETERFFLRFQELSLKYNLKTPWIKKTGLSSVDLEFVANNLFTIDKVKYFDPEQASANGAAYPIPATYTFQVYLKF